jgi:phosphatidylglycerophosphate synthase
MIEVQASDSLSDTIRRLSAAQKPSLGAPAYSRWVNRPVGRVLAAVCYRAGLTPNGVTAISALLSALGIAVLALVPPRWWTGLVVCGCLVTGYAFDSADGQLARLRGGGSVAGEWLDHMVDATKISALHLSVLISLYRFGDLHSALWYLVPIGFTVVSNTMFFGMILNEQLRRARGMVKPVQGPASFVRSLIVLPTDYGVLCLVVALLGWHAGFLGGYTALFIGNALFAAAKWVKWFSEMRQLDEGRR